MTAAPFDVKKMCCRVRDFFFSGGSEVCRILGVNVTGWHELKDHGCDGRTFGVIGEVRELGLELPQIQSAIHRALEDPPAKFSDSYLRGRFSSLRQFEGTRPDSL